MRVCFAVSDLSRNEGISPSFAVKNFSQKHLAAAGSPASRALFAGKISSRRRHYFAGLALCH
jgi:hypothetical protein